MACCLGFLPISVVASSQTLLVPLLLPNIYDSALKFFSICRQAPCALYSVLNASYVTTSLCVSPTWSALSGTPASHIPVSLAAPWKCLVGISNSTSTMRTPFRPRTAKTAALFFQWLRPNSGIISDFPSFPMPRHSWPGL